MAEWWQEWYCICDHFRFYPVKAHSGKSEHPWPWQSAGTLILLHARSLLDFAYAPRASILHSQFSPYTSQDAFKGLKTRESSRGC
jgi:hypothetical protein